ncbi:hypothetical protein SLINC_3934 [Streptomyces lincolnensis]|uniref:Secreted protein n=2 Tax=Streptomyces lincolnensis TaxID=1915 RepID=A0A1B1MC20_STRLN|nr:hypothetical protein SLINC_3934 [Streptomyces lincolnensis]
MMLLFLDVDGTLLPFGAAHPYPEYEARFALPEQAGAHPLLPRVDPALGARLGALGCELVWATTWMDDANTCLAPWLGLPALPLVDWPDEDEDEGGDKGGVGGGGEADGDTGAVGLHWKTRPLLARAADRPFVWVDDEITAADRAWVASHHPAPALLHRVDPRCGLTEADFVALEAWVRRTRG